MPFDPYYYSHERPMLRESARIIINEYLTNNGIKNALSQIKYLGDDHGYLKSKGIDKLKINHYRRNNMEIVNDRLEAFKKRVYGRGTKNYNINKIKFFKDIPDGVEVLIDYVDVTAIRTMYIPSEIIYESIYRELPELFEE